MATFLNVLFILGVLVIIVLALAGLVALVVHVMPEPRKRAIPRGTSAEHAETEAPQPAPIKPLLTVPGLDQAKKRAAGERVTQVQLNRARVEVEEADRAHRRELAEGRA